VSGAQRQSCALVALDCAVDTSTATGEAMANMHRVIVDERLAGRASVVFEAGSHLRSVRLKTVDLVRLTRAQVADIRSEEPTVG
jgi:prolyl-tRNA editing enzyme YbaK/EbsC (Cys-tRNA(Pro) deacylase)